MYVITWISFIFNVDTGKGLIILCLCVYTHARTHTHIYKLLDTIKKQKVWDHLFSHLDFQIHVQLWRMGHLNGRNYNIKAASGVLSTSYDLCLVLSFFFVDIHHPRRLKNLDKLNNIAFHQNLYTKVNDCLPFMFFEFMN